MQLAQSIYVTTDYNFNDQGRALLVNHCYGGLIWDKGELQLYGERLVAGKVYMNRGFARRPCCMPGTMKMFCIRMKILSHRNNIVLFLACNMAAVQNLYSANIKEKRVYTGCSCRKSVYI